MTDQEHEDRMDRINRTSNDVKIGSAMSLAVDSIYHRYAKAELTVEAKKKRAEELAKLWASGFEALRTQAMCEMLKLLTDDGKHLGKPGFGDELLLRLVFARMKGGEAADAAVKKFVNIAEEVAGDRLQFEFVDDGDDPRINPVDKNFPECEGSA